MTIKDFLNTKILEYSSEPIELPFRTWVTSISKGTVLTKFGQIERKGYFIWDGIILCAIEKDGQEKIIDIIMPNNFFCAYNSFISDEPSDIKIYALTNCKIEYMLKRDLQEAYHHSIVANKFARYLKENVLLKKVQREKDFLILTAEESYIQLLNENPEIVQYVPIKKIAQYLGIHPESLSRIRKRLTFLT